MNNSLRHVPFWIAVLALPACGPVKTTDDSVPQVSAAVFEQQRETVHRGEDDLLTAGLGLDGLRSPAAPAFADAMSPTAAEARRRAIWNNWRGIADLTPGGGFGEVYGTAQSVHGREFSAFAKVPGASQPHRVLVQVPDDYDLSKRCLVVTASSGSRGIYGAIAVASAWGLPRGCAVVHTDKGTGTDYYDLDGRIGVQADGTSSAQGVLAFEPRAAANASGIAFKHAHSGDNPEADWGRHVQQAMQFGLEVLGRVHPQAAPFTPDNTRIIAAGVSNGGGAVLRAAEIEDGWFDAVVAGEPNVSVAGAVSLYDVATQSALLMPCALLAVDDLPPPPMPVQLRPIWEQRCSTLHALGLVQGDDVSAQAKSAHAQLAAMGLDDNTLRAGLISVVLDMWRSVAAAYASAYGGHAAGEHPCGYGYAAIGADRAPQPATAELRAAWWSDASGIPPGAGIGLIDTLADQSADPHVPGLQCLRALSTQDSPEAQRVRAGIERTRATAPRAGLPVVIVHGTDDGVVPIALTSDRYVPMARAAGADVAYWRIRNAQHVDALMAFPDYRKRYVPLLPYMFAALDQVWERLDGATRGPVQDAVIEPTPRAEEPLQPAHLSIPAPRP